MAALQAEAAAFFGQSGETVDVFLTDRRKEAEEDGESAVRQNLSQSGLGGASSDQTVPPKQVLPRKQIEARRVASAAYPFQCCALCGLQVPTCLAVAHLDHNPGNNDPDNLAHLCHTHHWMHDAGLYPTAAIVMLRDHWQMTRGVPSHKARMKYAGRKAATARKKSAAARKAWRTRRETPTAT